MRRERVQGFRFGPANIELLHDIKLVLHIMPKDEEMIKVIYEGLDKPKTYLCLGRWEDLLMIEKLEVVDVERKELGEDYKLKHDAYVPVGAFNENDEESMATVYRINKKYSVNPKTKLRKWDEAIYVKHMSKNAEIFSGTNVYTDGEDLIFLS